MAEYLVSRRKVLAAVLLVAATAAWGSTFLVMKGAVANTPVPEFLGWRFALASLLLIGLRPGALTRLSRRGWAQGASLGVVLAAGYLLQTYGLQHTSAAISGFLTGLQVVFTPLLAWMLLGQRPGRRTWLAITVATSGLAELTLRGVSMGVGEILTIACAGLFALQIVGVSRWVSPEETYGLATVQLMVVAVLCFAVQAPSGVQVPASGAEWRALAVTAVAATAFAFAVQSWAHSSSGGRGNGSARRWSSAVLSWWPPCSSWRPARRRAARPPPPSRPTCQLRPAPRSPPRDWMTSTAMSSERTPLL